MLGPVRTFGVLTVVAGAIVPAAAHASPRNDVAIHGGWWDLGADVQTSFGLFRRARCAVGRVHTNVQLFGTGRGRPWMRDSGTASDFQNASTTQVFMLTAWSYDWGHACGFVRCAMSTGFFSCP